MTGLRTFVIEEHSRNRWEQVKEVAGVDTDWYTRMEDYPDEEFQGIYEVLLEDAGVSDAELQRTFGQFLFEKLADMYGQIYFDDEWGVLDLIDNVEETIHQSLKQRNDSGFTPPELETEPFGEDGLAVLYSSDRHLCEFGKGLIQGSAAHYGTNLTIEEPQCMKDGADICRIEVRQAD
ncbi:heme NO-binding domain-containing protein [Haloarcula sp. S1CR25-12]|uniref:Heme NO-binding domain-containing protein n=1 Tax=Haloarcula saliterrae TaxID=2950534 RepID=A0ABU2FAA0_9EURY|nr:heme NO-binding domain-containing protein [Haloarcula sp. S1CR25-12]MDS0259164.1 heme NO-binding domain-containing protein [Haloarcula sp. S1CR25-12]